MAKSMRSKRKRRLRTLRRDIAEPFYEKKEQAKLAAQEAALAAPKLEIPTNNKSQMEIEPAAETEPVTGANERVPMAIERSGRQKFKLKPVGGIEKEWKSNKQLKRERKQKHKKKKKLNL